ncbi:phasin family protein [Methylorubrum thiocyanatum]|uniref:phasin family protein n=1 Tax=Methylorubrum thiocyanatum TaxID=47958 RepID=UPI0036581F00
MSTSRRRGRSPGAPARPQPPTVTTTQAGVADALLAETPVGKDQEESPQETSAEPVTGEAEAPAVEAAAEQPATDGPAADAVKDEEVAAETGASSETAPAETQATETQATETQATETQAAADAAPAEAPPEEPTETVAAAAEAVATETGDLIETQAERLADAALAEAAPPVPAAFTPSEDAGSDAKSRTHSVRIGADFAFVPTFAPLTEINAKLFAFARGESEAALAHFQALARAKSPAEAIRLQVTEMQRAADASLTCFSEIVRSANRLTEIARRH